MRKTAGVLAALMMMAIAVPHVFAIEHFGELGVRAKLYSGELDGQTFGNTAGAAAIADQAENETQFGFDLMYLWGVMGEFPLGSNLEYQIAISGHGGLMNTEWSRLAVTHGPSPHPAIWVKLARAMLKINLPPYFTFILGKFANPYARDSIEGIWSWARAFHGLFGMFVYDIFSFKAGLHLETSSAAKDNDTHVGSTFGKFSEVMVPISAMFIFDLDTSEITAEVFYIWQYDERHELGGYFGWVFFLDEYYPLTACIEGSIPVVVRGNPDTTNLFVMLRIQYGEKFVAGDTWMIAAQFGFWGRGSRPNTEVNPGGRDAGDFDWANEANTFFKAPLEQLDRRWANNRLTTVNDMLFGNTGAGSYNDRTASGANVPADTNNHVTYLEDDAHIIYIGVDVWYQIIKAFGVGLELDFGILGNERKVGTRDPDTFAFGGSLLAAMRFP